VGAASYRSSAGLATPWMGRPLKVLRIEGKHQVGKRDPFEPSPAGERFVGSGPLGI
jgi:hypothetical protein